MYQTAITVHYPGTCKFIRIHKYSLRDVGFSRNLVNIVVDSWLRSSTLHIFGWSYCAVGGLFPPTRRMSYDTGAARSILTAVCFYYEPKDECIFASAINDVANAFREMANARCYGRGSLA